MNQVPFQFLIIYSLAPFEYVLINFMSRGNEIVCIYNLYFCGESTILALVETNKSLEFLFVSRVKYC